MTVANTRSAIAMVVIGLHDPSLPFDFKFQFQNKSISIKLNLINEMTMNCDNKSKKQNTSKFINQFGFRCQFEM